MVPVMGAIAERHHTPHLLLAQLVLARMVPLMGGIAERHHSHQHSSDRRINLRFQCRWNSECLSMLIRARTLQRIRTPDSLNGSRRGASVKMHPSTAAQLLLESQHAHPQLGPRPTESLGASVA
jgi:hypothetical protein